VPTVEHPYRRTTLLLNRLRPGNDPGDIRILVAGRDRRSLALLGLTLLTLGGLLLALLLPLALTLSFGERRLVLCWHINLL
jgi:hypothetical protein